MTFDKLAIAALVLVGLLLAPHGCTWVLDQWELDNCLRYQRHKEAGHPNVIPEWCYEEGFLERGGKSGT